MSAMRIAARAIALALLLGSAVTACASVPSSGSAWSSRQDDVLLCQHGPAYFVFVARPVGADAH